MSDIKLWLRNRNADYDGRPNIYGHALAEIERLEAELARKDAALRRLMADLADMENALSPAQETKP